MRNYIKKVLKNGVKLYLYIDPNMRKTYVDYGINYGSNGKYYKFYYQNKLYEVLPGCAHFLEHMLGEHSKYGNLYRIFSEKKYSVNATTYLDVTRFYFCGTEDILESIKMLINAVDNPVFTEEDINETRHAIIEETKRTLNNKYSLNMTLSIHNLFKDLNIFDETLCSIGNEETTKKLDYQMLKLCYDAFYYDKNKSLLIAGNFDEEKMTKYVESIYDELKPHQKEVKLYKYNLDKIKNKEEIRYLNVSENLVSIAFKENIKGYLKKEIMMYTRFIFYSKLLKETKFNEKLVKNNIISYIGSKWIINIDDNNFIIEIGASVKNIKVYLNKLIKELKNNNFKKQDFELFKKTIIADEAGKIDYKYSVFNSFQNEREYTDDFDEIEFFKSLSFDKFLEFYNKLNFDDYSVAIFKSNKEDNCSK